MEDAIKKCGNIRRESYSTESACRRGVNAPTCSVAVQWTVSKLGLVRIPFFELRSFGINQHRIFEASEGGAEHIFLSNRGRNLCASVCLHFYYVENRSSNDFTRGGCVAVTQCRILVQYGHVTRSELINLINYRTERAGSGAPHAGRAYMLRERTLH